MKILSLPFFVDFYDSYIHSQTTGFSFANLKYLPGRNPTVHILLCLLFYTMSYCWDSSMWILLLLLLCVLSICYIFICLYWYNFPIIPLCEYRIIYLCVLSLMNLWVVASSGLLLCCNGHLSQCMLKCISPGCILRSGVLGHRACTSLISPNWCPKGLCKSWHNG